MDLHLDHAALGADLPLNLLFLLHLLGEAHAKHVRVVLHQALEYVADQLGPADHPLQAGLDAADALEGRLVCVIGQVLQGRLRLRLKDVHLPREVVADLAQRYLKDMKLQ